MESKISHLDPHLNSRLERLKSDKALEEFFKKSNIKKDKDVREIYLPFLDLSELQPLDRFKNLNILWLHSNRIHRLPFLQHCHSLAELHLQNNFIQSIDNTLGELVNLRLVNLHGNQLINLENVATELAHLKALKVLNLFDNPISLEKSYKSTILYHVPSLEVFDRNTVKPKERVESIKKFEPDQVAIHERYAFNKSLDFGDKRNLVFNRTRRAAGMRAMDSSRLLRSSAADFMEQSLLKKFQQNSEVSLMGGGELTEREQGTTPDRKKNYMFNRSIKEFSFFDWSKVKLNDENGEAFRQLENASSVGMPSNQKDLPLSDLPQVITIRFT